MIFGDTKMSKSGERALETFHKYNLGILSNSGSNNRLKGNLQRIVGEVWKINRNLIRR